MSTVVQHWEVFGFHKVSSLVSQQIRTFSSILRSSSTLLPSLPSLSSFGSACLHARTTDLWSCALCCYTTRKLQRSSNTPSSVHISSFVGLSNNAFRRLTDGSSTYCQRRKIWPSFHSLLLRETYLCERASIGQCVSANRWAICRKARPWLATSTARTPLLCNTTTKVYATVPVWR